MGHSIGAGPATWLASQRPSIGGLILLSPYTSVRNIFTDHHSNRCFSALCPIVFDNETAIAQVKAPILIIHGRRDTLISPKHSTRLLECATRSASKVSFFAPGATHNVWLWKEQVIDPVSNFLSNIKK
jgi:pimeloyl-ACP methyl ester carboxylesterase